MTYEEFLKFVPAKCIHEALYEDTEGRPILVISMLDAYDMVNKAQRPWVGLTVEEIGDIYNDTPTAKVGQFVMRFARAIEAKLKEKNNV
jgi:hypothetical protein